MTGRRLAGVLVGAVAWLTVTAAPAAADPAGPTDFLTTVVDVTPAATGFETEVIGGDSFLLLRSDGSALIEVTGYRGEPYLRFLPGGTVEQNDRSPTAYLNEDRYAAVEIPAEADADAEPRWREVASDGSYAWHDHRAHWMNEAAPPGRGPGDTILEGVIPLFVDGTEVDLTVRSVWQDPPSPLPVVLGTVLGLVLSAAVFLRRRITAAATAAAVMSAAAVVLGIIAYRSVPPETAPSWSLWVPPAMSLALAGAALLPKQSARRWAPALVLVAAVELVAWSIVHRDWIWRSILPTAAPFWAERLVTVAALIGGIGVAAAAIGIRLRDLRRSWETA
jgi:hypothetical protein